MHSTTETIQLLTMKEVCSLLNRSRSSIYRDVQKGRFPQPVKLGASTRFRADQIQAFVMSQALDRPHLDPQFGAHSNG